MVVVVLVVLVVVVAGWVVVVVVLVSVVAYAEFEKSDSPTVLYAVTLNQYVVEGVKPDTRYVVALALTLSI